MSEFFEELMTGLNEAVKSRRERIIRQVQRVV